MTPNILLFTSVIFIICGLVLRYAKLKRNYFIGYRTPKALANEHTWEYSNSLFGKILIIYNTLTFIVATFEILYGKVIHIFYILNFLIFIIGIVFSIYLTETRLKQKFFNV